MSRRVKIVEDNEDIAFMLTAMLEQGGVESHVHSENFARLLHEDAWEGCEVAVVDLMLNSVSGIDVLQWLATHKPKVRRVAMTASLVHASEATGLADVVLVKPFHHADLMRAIHD